jgi:(p)ppGpp synthase/HD superfamily hydrolase
MAPLSPKFEEAFLYAHQLHQTQRRKGSDIPYMAHLMAVSSLALEYGASEDEAIAALLHDAVEDQGGPPVLAEIQDRFGQEIAQMVLGCSDYFEPPKPSWQERKQNYIDEMTRAPHSILLISLCDKLHNARAILMDHYRYGEAVWDRFAGKKEGTLWYYSALVEAYRLHPEMAPELVPLVDELERVLVSLKTRL